jgi:hypothetical protein
MTDDWIGKFVIARGTQAGVHAGVLVSRDGAQCELKEARRLWRWRVKANAGITLSDVATYGLDKRDSRIGAAVSVVLTEVCEFVECSKEAAENIAQLPTYEP